jgi:hypothetical protein
LGLEGDGREVVTVSLALVSVAAPALAVKIVINNSNENAIKIALGRLDKDSECILRN